MGNNNSKIIRRTSDSAECEPVFDEGVRGWKVAELMDLGFAATVPVSAEQIQNHAALENSPEKSESFAH
eukprot:2289451-Rhodomonas_salina.1